MAIVSCEATLDIFMGLGNDTQMEPDPGSRVTEVIQVKRVISLWQPNFVGRKVEFAKICILLQFSNGSL